MVKKRGYIINSIEQEIRNAGAGPCYNYVLHLAGVCHPEDYIFGRVVFSQRTEFMYFSLTTFTTLGYGDLTPVNVFARSLATRKHCMVSCIMDLTDKYLSLFFI
jgi:hypothetical protein